MAMIKSTCKLIWLNFRSEIAKPLVVKIIITVFSKMCSSIGYCLGEIFDPVYFFSKTNRKPVNRKKLFLDLLWPNLEVF